jgi:hypothetical protein
LFSCVSLVWNIFVCNYEYVLVFHWKVVKLKVRKFPIDSACKPSFQIWVLLNFCVCVCICYSYHCGFILKEHMIWTLKNSIMEFGLGNGIS